MKLETLPFDQYQRYRLVADALRDVAGERRLRVLEVGGRTGLLAAFLPECDVIGVDVEPPPPRAKARPPFVLGDGARLPFHPESFDAVCALDTLEHVPEDARAAFVDELWTVARSWVVLAGPYHSPEVARAERLLARFLRDKLGQPHRYLEEHRALGLPRRTVVERWLREGGGRVTHVGHGQLERWSALMTLAVYLDANPTLRKLARSVHSVYNRALFASDRGRPVYRHVVVGAFGEAPLPDWSRVLPEPEADSAGARRFEALLGRLDKALVAFDHEREAWGAERHAFREVIATLEADLAGHRAALASAEAERQAALASMRVMERDLEGHRAALAELRLHLEELEAARAEVQAERDAALQSVRVLESDLEGHRHALEVMGRDLEGHRGALSDLRSAAAHESELRTELSANQAKLHTERERLRVARRTIRELRADLMIERAAQAAPQPTSDRPEDRDQPE